MYIRKQEPVGVILEASYHIRKDVGYHFKIRRMRKELIFGGHATDWVLEL